MSLPLFLRSMRDRRDWHGSRPKRVIYAIKYAASYALRMRPQGQWLRFLYEQPQMAAIQTRDPYLFDRPLHRYINCQFDVATRFAVIADHYRFLCSQLPQPLLDVLYTEGKVSLGAVELKHGGTLAISLAIPAGRGREGELCLRLTDAQDRVLSSLIFTIADQGRSLLIGCLQGACSELGREDVRTLTKQCYGLRPKNLLLSLILAFAEDRCIERVRGISQAAHPFSLTRGKIKADYDSFWQECGGRLLADGFFELPSREPMRDEMQVESKHRSAFRKREALRWEAAHLFIAALRGEGIDAHQRKAA